MSSSTVEARSEAQVALERAREHLLSLQDEAGLVAGRAADERHDGRRGHAAARVPRHPPRRRDRALGRLDPLAAARRRHVGELPRRPGRAVDDDRGLLGAAPRRRRARAPRTCARRPSFIRAQGGLERARVFTHVWLALFGLWSWERGAGAAARDRPAARVGAAEHLRLRLLGAPDDRRAVARQGPAPRAPAAVRRSTSCAAPRGAGRRARRRARAARRWLGAPGPRCCAPTSAARSRRCAGSRSRAPSAGSCAARRPTAPGAASSRRGSTR